MFNLKTEVKEVFMALQRNWYPMKVLKQFLHIFDATPNTLIPILLHLLQSSFLSQHTATTYKMLLMILALFCLPCTLDLHYSSEFLPENTVFLFHLSFTSLSCTIHVSYYVQHPFFIVTVIVIIMTNNDDDSKYLCHWY